MKSEEEIRHMLANARLKNHFPVPERGLQSPILYEDLIRFNERISVLKWVLGEETGEVEEK
jgi:hypothetical protein